MKEENSEQIMTCQRQFVSWKVFAWIIGIVLLVFGWVITAQASLASKISDNQIDNSEIQAQLSQIQTDLSWIKLELQNR